MSEVLCDRKMNVRIKGKGVYRIVERPARVGQRH